MSAPRFTEPKPTPDASWRSVVLFGVNVASYKFALAKSLLELARDGRDHVSLAELAEPFSFHICEHLGAVDKQSTSSQSRFLDACRAFNAGQSDKASLIATTEKLGFQNVIDAFHVVQGEEIAVRFFHDERRGWIRLQKRSSIDTGSRLALMWLRRSRDSPKTRCASFVAPVAFQVIELGPG